jgi:hypothetical protein
MYGFSLYVGVSYTLFLVCSCLIHVSVSLTFPEGCEISFLTSYLFLLDFGIYARFSLIFWGVLTARLVLESLVGKNPTYPLSKLPMVVVLIVSASVFLFVFCVGYCSPLL